MTREQFIALGFFWLAGLFAIVAINLMLWARSEAKSGDHKAESGARWLTVMALLITSLFAIVGWAADKCLHLLSPETRERLALYRMGKPLPKYRQKRSIYHPDKTVSPDGEKKPRRADSSRRAG